SILVLSLGLKFLGLGTTKHSEEH
ncbi:MAG: YqhA family protein, partial [Pseudomonadota bacterium]